MKKFFIIGLALGVLLSMANVLFAEGNAVTMADFAKQMVDKLGIADQLPPNLSALSAQEAYDAMANLLVSRGISAFVGAESAANVTKGFFAEVMYAIVNPTPDLNATAESKITYLVSAGIMTVGSAADPISAAEIALGLSNTQVDTAIAERYSAPPVDNPPAGDNPQPPEPVTERASGL